MAKFLAWVEHSFTSGAAGIASRRAVLAVQAKLTDAQTTFENWGKIRTHPAANEYLLVLLIGNKRE
jgi:hypothetical protein